MFDDHRSKVAADLIGQAPADPRISLACIDLTIEHGQVVGVVTQDDVTLTRPRPQLNTLAKQAEQLSRIILAREIPASNCGHRNPRSNSRRTRIRDRAPPASSLELGKQFVHDLENQASDLRGILLLGTRTKFKSTT